LLNPNLSIFLNNFIFPFPRFNGKFRKFVGIDFAPSKPNKSIWTGGLIISMKRNGFSLIEILIALVILSVTSLALAGLMVQTTKNTSSGGRMTEAATFAQDKLEELKATPWADMTSGSDRMSLNGMDYARTWTVVPNEVAPPFPEPTLKTITITVNWNDKTNHSIRFLSVIANPNPK
jgi:prepilin-type N-terminal cleavage/methylation domain-containing protein